MPSRTTTLAILAFVSLGVSTIAGPQLAAAQTADDLFRPDVLHEVHLRVHSRDWARLKATYLQNTDYPCDFTWNGVRVPNAAIRSRGTFTRSGVKPGLRVDFDRYVPGRRFAGQATLVLDNLLQDPAMMREVIATRVYARAGLPAPRESFARLSVNGTYQGLYAIVEAVDTPFLDRVYGESDGHLYEYRWLDYWYFTYPALHPYLAVFEPRTHPEESLDALAAPIEELIRTANETDDESFEAAMSRLMPLDELLAHVAIDQLVTNNDGLVGSWGVNNVYLYRSGQTGLWRVLPWDLDVSMIWTDLPLTARLDENVLVRRAFAIPWLQAHYYTVLAATSDSVSMDTGEPEVPTGITWLQAQVDEAYSLIHDAVVEDTLKPYSNEEFEAAVEFLRFFAVERPRYVRCEAARALGDPAAETVCAGR